MLAVGSWGAAALSAQSKPTAADRQTAGWVLTPSIAFGGSWDDNVLLVDPGDTPPSDYATPISPSISLDYRNRRTMLSSAYDGSFLMYRTLSELNSSEQRVRGLLEHRVTSRLTLSANESYARAPTTDMLQLAGIPFYRVGSRTNAAGGGFAATIAKHTVLRSEYTLRSVAFEPDPRAGQNLLGGHAHEVLVSLARAVSRRLTWGGEYEIHRAVVSAGKDHFNMQTGSMTAQYDVAPAVTVSGLLGVARLGAGLTHEPRIGPTVRAGITGRTPHAVLSAVYERSFIPSYGFGGTFQNEDWQGNAHVPFARRGYVDASIARAKNDPLELEQPSLRSFWLSGTLGYHATPWLSVEGFYGRSHQSTGRPGGDLGRNQVGFRVVAAKPVRLR